MLKRAYIEITNVCNLKCSFCHGTVRPKHFMSLSDFNTITAKIRPYTKHIYLHVLGEPLLHPELEGILQSAEAQGFQINVTTNGTLIKKQEALLLEASSIRKVSLSLHSFESNNEGDEGLRSYLEDVWSFCEKAPFITALRLWNEGGENELNSKIFAFLSEKLGVDVTLIPAVNGDRKLRERFYLECAERFEWPDTHAEDQHVQFCHGLSRQIAVLCDGTVVPCCLDSEGDIPLGNLLNEELGDILKSPRALEIIEGFRRRTPSEELCKRCQYASRFNL